MSSSKKTSKSSLSRKKIQREPYDLILIVCEGSKTEPYYFEDLKKAERLASANVVVTGDCGSDPLSVVRHGIELYEKSVKEKNPSTLYDIVFCVIDRDAHQTFNDALLLANQYNKSSNKSIIYLIKSYPSFEVWYLFHLLYTRQAFTRTPTKSDGQRCKEALNIEWRKLFNEDYSKAQSNIYSKLKAKNLIEVGIKNSQLALKDSLETGHPNPSTNAHNILEFLLDVRAQGYGVKGILDDIYAMSYTIERKLLEKHDDDSTYLVLLNDYSSTIQAKINGVNTALSAPVTIINKTRLGFIKSYLHELNSRITIAKTEIVNNKTS